jgi:hypothetical protein
MSTWLDKLIRHTGGAGWTGATGRARLGVFLSRRARFAGRLGRLALLLLSLLLLSTIG